MSWGTPKEPPRAAARRVSRHPSTPVRPAKMYRLYLTIVSTCGGGGAKGGGTTSQGGRGRASGQRWLGRAEVPAGSSAALT